VNGTRESRWSRRALLATALAFPAIHVPRALFGRNQPIRPPRPFVAHIVLVTFSAPRPSMVQVGRGGALKYFHSRAFTLRPVFADADTRIPAATSLLLGAGPRSHGVRAANHRVREDAWTLPRSALAAGYHTAALTTEPLVSLVGVPGFAETVEGEGWQRVAALACERIEMHAGRGLFMWVDAPAFVAERSPVDALLAALFECIERVGTLDRTTVVVTALPTEPATAEDQLIVPFMAQYSGTSNDGERSRTLLGLSDVAPGLSQQFRLPGPHEIDTGAPTGRGASYVSAINAPVFETVRCEGAFGVAIRAPGEDGRFPGVRALLRAEDGRDLSKAITRTISEPDTSSARGVELNGKKRDDVLALLARSI